MNIKKAVTTFKQMPWGTKLELFFYPILLIWRMPIAWTKSLWEARILLNGRWHRYMGFHPQIAINSLFYRTQWINLDRYGRKGVSPILGLGQYPLKNWFHLSLLSSYIYANAGAVTTLLGTLFWVFSHLIWIDSVGSLHVLVITMILFFSTTAYAMAFARQNYQILGWMWLPMALYGVSSEQWALAAFAWFAAGMAGITPVFFAVPIMIMMSLMSESWLPILVLIPALILTASRLLPLILEGGLSSALTNTAKMIGMTQRKVRYNREMNRWSIFTLYFFSLYAISALALWWVTDQLPALLLLGAGLFLVNQRFFRVADEQSVLILNVTLWALVVMQNQGSWLLPAIFWLAASPLGVLLAIQSRSRLEMLVNQPFDTEAVLQKLRNLVSEVLPGEVVYCAFGDPNGRYSNIFDGYRIIHESVLCVAAEKGIHAFPDWYAVAETNYEGAPQCWGRSVDAVVTNCAHWDADYALIYQAAGTEIDEKWLHQFEVIGSVDWADITPASSDVQLWSAENPTPKWFLLKKR
jgi:hypothetical protein